MIFFMLTFKATLLFPLKYFVGIEIILVWFGLVFAMFSHLHQSVEKLILAQNPSTQTSGLFV